MTRDIGTGVKMESFTVPIAEHDELKRKAKAMGISFCELARRIQLLGVQLLDSELARTIKQARKDYYGCLLFFLLFTQCASAGAARPVRRPGTGSRPTRTRVVRRQERGGQS